METMKKTTLKKFNILVDEEVKEIFESGKWHIDDLPEIEEAVIELLDSIYIIEDLKT
jgi:DNA-directed RNA polymerase subunit H (RpoH/RPB5)